MCRSIAMIARSRSEIGSMLENQVEIVSIGTSIASASKLFGVASSNALVNTYYPDTDRGFRPSITAYGTNLLTTAATNQIDEFLPQLIKAVRHKKSH